MSKLSKLQDAKLEKLRSLSSAGRDQLEAALEQPVPQSPITSTETSLVAQPVEQGPAQAEPARLGRTKRIGRPPLGPDMRASTVYLPESAYEELEKLAGKSGKKGFKRPGLSETVRAVIRLAMSREWSPEEIRQAFSEAPEE